MDALAWAEIAALVVVLVGVTPLVWLFLRRRWLARQGSMFECSLRLKATTSGAGWVLGVARYSEEDLEWFRVFSLSFQPRLRFNRPRTRALDDRLPNPIESVLLFDGQRVVALSVVEGERDLPDQPLPERAANPGEWELAMSQDALTGLRSWLEAAPPGEH